MAFAAPQASRGIRVIAMSRFGYLRTPMPANGSAEAQADAFVCVMDALDLPTAAVMGGSAGALSALQLPVLHPCRVSALVLLVPLGHKPPGEANSAKPTAPMVESTMMWVIGSDFLLWSAMQVARNQIIASVLATAPDLVATASLAEQTRINAMLDSILPVLARTAGLRTDTAAGKTMTPVDLSRVQCPTLIITARDDGYSTYASAEYMGGKIKGAQFLVFETGGHTWVSHNDEVVAAIGALMSSPQDALP